MATQSEKLPATHQAGGGFGDLPRQFGKYTLLRGLATGGMAQLYLAIQRAVAGFEKLVVIKQILPELTRDKAFVEMLLSEARTAATLNHPNVVQTFDVGEVDGVYFIAMGHINGEDIRSIVRGMRRAQVTAFPIEHTLAIINGVCAGLAYAHEKRGLDGELLNIVHRDVSPQNILVTYTGDVKVVDFGIAKSTEAIVGEQTAAGQLKGKVPYMSPEQARGEQIDHRSDIFATGILLFELTTGRRLFKAKSDYETLKLICERDYPSPSKIVPGYPLALEQIVMKALAKERDHRYQSASDMQGDLERFIRQERIAVSTVSLGKWMTMLFGEKIEEQKEALQDAKQLADVIAGQQADSDDLYISAVHSGTTTGGAIMDRSTTGVRPYRSARTTQLFAIGAIVLALLGGGVFMAMRKSPPPSVAPQAATVEQAPVAVTKKGRLLIESEPEGAYLRVAGELQGSKTPTTLEQLPLGMAIEVKLSKEGYEDHVFKVEFDEEELEQKKSVQLVKGSVTLVFKVDPSHAVLMLDGKRWEGQGNTVEGLSTGEHKAVFAAAGYETAVAKFVAKKGETKKVDIKLNKAAPRAAGGASKPTAQPAAKAKGSGRVNVASRGGYCANVIIGGRSVGPTPVAGVSVPAGPTSIICKLPDGRTVGSGAMVKDGQTARVTIRIPK